MRPRTTRELADWVERSIRDYPTSLDNQPCDRTAIAAKLRKLAEIEGMASVYAVQPYYLLTNEDLGRKVRELLGVPYEDARPEQPEAIPLDLTQFDREALRGLRPGQLQSMLHEFMPVTRSEFEALVSRVEACEGRE